MNALLTWFHATNGATRRAMALTVVLVVGLAVVLTRVPLPLEARAFAVSGQSVVAHPDGNRLLMQQEHAISVVDAAIGAVTATIPLGSLEPNRGIAFAPGTSQALLVAEIDQDAVSVTVDVDAARVAAVTALENDYSSDVREVRPAGVDRSGAVVVRGGTALGDRAVGRDGRVWQTAVTGGIDGLPGAGTDTYYHLSLAPGGELLYAVGIGRALVVDTASGRIEKDVRWADPDPGVTSGGWTVLLAADGEHVFTSSSADSRVTVRTLAGAAVATIETGVRSAAGRIALSPDGATLYTALDDRLLAIDVSAYA